jgi:hypothetical protein
MAAEPAMWATNSTSTSMSPDIYTPPAPMSTLSTPHYRQLSNRRSSAAAPRPRARI